MDNQKAKMLGRESCPLQENAGKRYCGHNRVPHNRRSEIRNRQCRRHPTTTFSTVTELERQLHTARFGDIPERLEESREYKTARKLEQALNDMGFNPERFARNPSLFSQDIGTGFLQSDESMHHRYGKT